MNRRRFLSFAAAPIFAPLARLVLKPEGRAPLREIDRTFDAEYLVASARAFDAEYLVASAHSPGGFLVPGELREPLLKELLEKHEPMLKKLRAKNVSRQLRAAHIKKPFCTNGPTSSSEDSPL